MPTKRNNDSHRTLVPGALSCGRRHGKVSWWPRAQKYWHSRQATRSAIFPSATLDTGHAPAIDMLREILTRNSGCAAARFKQSGRRALGIAGLQIKIGRLTCWATYMGDFNRNRPTCIPSAQTGNKATDRTLLGGGVIVPECSPPEKCQGFNKNYLASFSSEYSRLKIHNWMAKRHFFCLMQSYSQGYSYSTINLLYGEMMKDIGATAVIELTSSMKRISAHIEALQLKYRLLEENEKRRRLAEQVTQQTSSD